MSSDYDDLDAGVFTGEHVGCIIHEIPEEKWGKRRSCNSSDGLAIYEHVDEDTGEIWYDGFCWPCKGKFTKKEIKESSVGPQFYEGQDGKPKKPRASKREPITPEEKARLFSTTGYEGKGIRGLKDEYLKFYGHRTRLSPDGTPIARYYPETQEGKGVVGWKCRIFPKDFSRGKLGVTGNSCQLSGQVAFKSGGKYVLIVGGEEDKVAAYQMLEDNKRKRGKDYKAVAVVSPTSGEGSAAKQIAANIDFFDDYDEIILGLDNDEAGIEAMKECAKVIPKDKLKIAKWTGKDPNKMLLDGNEDQFVRDFYSAREHVPNGIKSSLQIDEELTNELLLKKIGLPAFMHKLEDMMYGGIPLGYIVNIIADTGIGKTEYVNAMIMDWIFNSPHKVGVVSLELTAGQYGIAMLSKYIGRNLLRFREGQEAVDYINTPEVLKAREELWTNEWGEPRWALLDERDGTVEGLQVQIERLVKKHGCKLIIIDVLSDLLEGLSNEEQGLHMKWQKNLIKSGVTIVNVVHSRKPQSDKNGKSREITEYDAYGSSTIVKSSGCNILLSRDKLAEDVVLQNTTKVRVSKCRWSGCTGEGGNWYYDGETRRSYDYDDFFGGDHTEPQTIEGALVEAPEEVVPEIPEGFDDHHSETEQEEPPWK